MSNLFYTQKQLKIFAEDLLQTFVRSGFEILEEPRIDYALYGFRATYVRRYMLHKPTPYYDGILSNLVQVVGLPFGKQNQKMVVLSSPRNMNNEPISDTLKIRIQIDEDNTCRVIHNEQNYSSANKSESDELIDFGKLSNQQQEVVAKQLNLERQEDDYKHSTSKEIFANELKSYVTHILEIISPGLIELPTEMKLEILKKLSIDSIMKMSQVNNEFRYLIFKFGESLWRHLCYRDFKIKTIDRRLDRTWLQLYHRLYIMHQIEVCRKERALPGLPERPALPPAPHMLQIEWFPEVLELPFNPMNEVVLPMVNEQLNLALELPLLQRADSLDSIQ